MVQFACLLKTWNRITVFAYIWHQYYRKSRLRKFLSRFKSRFYTTWHPSTIYVVCYWQYSFLINWQVLGGSVLTILFIYPTSASRHFLSMKCGTSGVELRQLWTRGPTACHQTGAGFHPEWPRRVACRACMKLEGGAISLWERWLLAPAIPCGCPFETNITMTCMLYHNTLENAVHLHIPGCVHQPGPVMDHGRLFWISRNSHF